MTEFISLVLSVSVFGFIIIFASIYINNTKRLAEMSDDDRAEFLAAKKYGARNEHLVCSHCQTKGTVRALSVIRNRRSTSLTGNIIKTKTVTSEEVSLTQLHCDKCLMSVDV